MVTVDLLGVGAAPCVERTPLLGRLVGMDRAIRWARQCSREGR